MSSRRDTTTQAVVGLVMVGVIALAVVTVAGVTEVRRLGADQAIEDARQVTQLDARLVQRRIDDGILTGDARSLASVAAVIYEAVLRDPVVRVKIWSQRGEILYSDESRLIGLTEPLSPDKQQVIADGGTVAQVSDLTGGENRYERDFGQLTEVYTRIETPDGTPLLFESYQRTSQITDTGREIAGTYTPVLIVTLVGAAAVEIALTSMLIRRVRRSQRQRVRLMQHAVDASDRERRRIAADLHDGPVQEMAGLALSLSARAESNHDQPTRRVFLDAAGAVRDSVRTLRTAIAGIYPPDLAQSGLVVALGDLVERLADRGLHTELNLPPELSLNPGTQALLYRACQEALRNVEKHADASRASIALHHNGGSVTLTVEDDGRGTSEGVSAVTDDAAHFGLAVLGDMVRSTGGTLTVQFERGRRDDGTRPGAGPVITIVVADDHQVVRIGLEQLLATFGDVEVVGSAAGGDDAVALCRALRPDVLLLDLSMPDRDGAQVAEAVTTHVPETRIIMFTSFSERAGILSALDAGAVGFLFKDADPDEIHGAILAATRGEAPIAPKAAMVLLGRQAGATGRDVELTGREREVLGLVLAGLANKQIARRLGISEKTVKGHLTNLFQRIGVTDRTQAALWAERTGALRAPGSRD